MQVLEKQDGIAHGSIEAQQTVCKVMSRIQQEWDLTNLEIANLLHVRANTYGNWLKAGKVPMGKPPFTSDMESLIALIAIHRSLAAMFSDSSNQVLWLQTPHPDFQNQTPFDFAVSSLANLFYLKAYLDYVRGRGA